MSRQKEDQLAIRCDSNFLLRLRDLWNQRGFRSQSAYIRRVLDSESDLWNRSPYVIQTATHFVVVSRDGTFLYHPQEELYFNSPVTSLPASIRAKKGIRMAASRSRGPRWASNHFFLLAKDGRVLASETDNADTQNKCVVFPGRFGRGAAVIREGLFVIENYVQYDEDVGETDDRADFLVEIPTNKFEAILVADRRLFDQPARNPGALRMQLRNLEEVRLEDDHIEAGSAVSKLSNTFPFPNGSKVDRPRQAAVQTINERFAGLRKVAERSSSRGLPKGMEELPKEYFFYRLQVQNPTVGLTISIAWSKPGKTR